MADELTPEDRRLLSEVNVKLSNVHEKLDELKKVLFGEHADGFLYKFAGMEPNIKLIPEIKQKLDDVISDTEELTGKVEPMVEKVKAHEDALRVQRLIRTLIVIGISTVTSAVMTILTIWTLFNTLLEQLKKGVHP